MRKQLSTHSVSLMLVVVLALLLTPANANGAQKPLRISVQPINHAEHEGFYPVNDGQPLLQHAPRSSALKQITDTQPMTVTTLMTASLSLAVESPQATNGRGFTITQITVPQSGWIVVHQNDDGSVGKVVAAEPLSTGEHSRIQIVFDKPDYLLEDASVWIILLKDRGVSPETLTLADEFDNIPSYQGPHPVQLHVVLTPTPSASITPTATLTPTLTPSPTMPPTPTATSTSTPNIDATVRARLAATLTLQAALTPPTAAPTATPTATPTPTNTATSRPRPIQTAGKTPGTSTVTPTITPNATATELVMVQRVRATLLAEPTNTPNAAATKTALALLVDAALTAQPTATAPPTPVLPTSTSTPNVTATQRAFAAQIGQGVAATLTAQPPPPTPTSTPKPPPLQVTPAILVENQETDGRDVVVDQVVAPQESWLVITDRNDPPKQYGRTKVPAGYNSHVEVIFLNQPPIPQGTNLRASLYLDIGVVGKFEPQVDRLVVAKDFVLRDPVIKVSNQQVTKGAITVDEVFANQAGWVVLYDHMPAVVGYTSVAAGDTANITVLVHSSLQSPLQLTAVLHVDSGQKGKFEFPGADTVVLVNNKMVQAPFIATVAPTITVTPPPPPPITVTPVGLPPIEQIIPTQRCNVTKDQADTWGEKVPLAWQLELKPGVAKMDMNQYPDYYLTIVVWPEGVNPLTDHVGAPAITGELFNRQEITLQPKPLAINKLLREKTNYRWGIVLVHRGDDKRLKQLAPDCWFRIPEGFSAP